MSSTIDFNVGNVSVDPALVGELNLGGLVGGPSPADGPGGAEAAAILDEAKACLAEGEAEGALRLLEGLLPGNGDAWALAAFAAESVGAIEDAAAYLRAARSRPSTEEGRGWMDQVEAALAIYSGRAGPGPGMLGLLASLISRTPLEEWQLQSAELDLVMLGRVVMNLIQAGRGHDLEPLFEARAESLIPGIHEGLRLVLSEIGAEVTDDGEPNYIFIGGVERSGATLFRAMLGSHPNIHAGPELKIVASLVATQEAWGRHYGAALASNGISQTAVDHATRSFLMSLLSSVGLGKRVAEKTPHNLLYMRTLGRLFPRARFIHVVRDGRSVAASLVSQPWTDGATGQTMPQCESAVAAARSWVETVTEVRRQAGSVPGRYLEVRYEALVNDPVRVMGTVLAFLGEPWSDRVLHHTSSGVQLPAHELASAEVKKPLHNSDTHLWRRKLTIEDLDEVSAVAGPTLRLLGYT